MPILYVALACIAFFTFGMVFQYWAEYTDWDAALKRHREELRKMEVVNLTH